jgi:predicted O-methyltransferase YrrM
VSEAIAWTLASVSTLAAAGLLVRVAKDRAKLHQRGLVSRWPIASVEAGEIVESMRAGELGPSLDSLVQITPSIGVRGGISELESCFLCAAAKGAARAATSGPVKIFEFGTCTGKTTYLLALNARVGAEGGEPRVVTLTLAPEQVATYQKAGGDDPRDTHAAIKESAFTRFYYTGTAMEPRIAQLFGDSKAFETAGHEGVYDLVFVDGSHARSYVESDSRRAMMMVKPGGLVAWHDYRGPWRARGVWSTLNALARTHELKLIKGTSIVVWRRPTDARR